MLGQVTDTRRINTELGPKELTSEAKERERAGPACHHSSSHPLDVDINLSTSKRRTEDPRG